MPNNEIGFRSGDRCGRVEERTRVTMRTRARKGTRRCRQIFLRPLRTKLSRMFLLRVKEIRKLSVKMADASGNLKITGNDAPNFVVKGMKCQNSR